MTLPQYQSKGTPAGILNRMMGSNPQPSRYVAGGGTINTAVTGQIATPRLSIIALGAITQWNVSIAAVAPDETELVIAAPGGAVTTLAITGSTFVGTLPTSLAQNASVSFRYRAANSTWYRAR